MWKPHLDSLKEQKVMNNWELKRLAVGCEALCPSVTCLIGITKQDHYPPMAVRWSVFKCSAGVLPHRWPAGTWHGTRVKGWEKGSWWLCADGVGISGGGSDVERGVQLCAKLLVCCEIGSTFSSLVLVMDFTFYKDMIKLVMYAGKKMYGQGFKL